MQVQNLGKLNIIVAVYGLKTITDKVANLVSDEQPQTLNFTVNNLLIGEDGWRGQRKSLLILYNYDGGDLQVVAAKEGDEIAINPGTLNKPKLTGTESQLNADRLSVLAASYGPDDVTYKVRNLISQYNTLSFTVGNNLFGDAWYGVAKTLVIVLGYGNEIRDVEIFTEREVCYIDLNEVIPSL
jgi:hypothetical protein